LTRRDTLTLFSSCFWKNFPNIGVDKYVIFGVLKMRRRQETGDRQKTEDRRQETEDRRQKTGDRR